MKPRILLYFSLFTMHYSPCTAQTWEPVGGGINNTDSTQPPVHAFCVYNNRLYVGGEFNHAGKLQANSIASWDGKNWDTLTTGIQNGTAYMPYPAHVDALTAYDNMLCVGGVFDAAGRNIRTAPSRSVTYTPPNSVSLALWIDTIHTIPAWYPVQGGLGYIEEVGGPGENNMAFKNVCVRTLCIYNDNLVIGGIFNNPGELGESIQDFAIWNYKNGWSGEVDKSKSTPAKPVYKNADVQCVTSMLEYKGKLVIASDIKLAPFYEERDSNRVISVYNGTAFKGIATGVANKHLAIPRCMAIYNSNLYVGGLYYSNPRTYGIIKWDGKKWSPVGKNAWGKRGVIWAMAVYKGKLYIGGRFDDIDGKPCNNIAVWDGKTFQPVGKGLSGKGKRQGVVRALCVYKDELYAGGEFSASGNAGLSNIAKLGH